MKSTLITNIRQLVQVEAPGNQPVDRVYGEQMKQLPSIDNAWLRLENGFIHSFGAMDTLPEKSSDQFINAAGKLVLPAWCDSHTHLVFAANREGEFADRIKGLSYEEIAKRGGGILNSAAKLNATDENRLYDLSVERLERLMKQGTGPIEMKSGYGLCLEGELKMLRVIRRLKENNNPAIRATFLAAHAYPVAYRENRPAYISHIINDMLPIVAGEGLADYIDVFCEEGFFSVADTDRILEAGWKYGLKPKIHANQLHYSGGVQAGIRNRAISVDHLECVGDEEISALKASDTLPVLLPGAAFFLGMHYQPARKMLDAGLPVCLATDYNPGSCPSGNVSLLLSIACTQLRMTPEEAINSVTINGAAAMEWQHEYGSIAIGKKADLIITRQVESVATLPYDFGNNNIEQRIRP